MVSAVYAVHFLMVKTNGSNGCVIRIVRNVFLMSKRMGVMDF